MEFAGWASQLPGAGILTLARDDDEGRFLSYGRWDDMAAVRAFKGSPEFKERMGRVQRHVDRFVAAELDVVATADAGSVTA